MKKLMLPIPAISKSPLTKCVKCKRSIETGEYLIKIPTLTEVGNNTYWGSSNACAGCFEQIAQGVVAKAEEKAQKFRENQARIAAGVNLAEPKISVPEGQILKKERRQ